MTSQSTAPESEPASAAQQRSQSAPPTPTPVPAQAGSSGNLRCRQCGGTFDLGDVEVTGRYADCDMFKAPCCGASCDTRMRWGGPSWARMGYDDMREFRRVEDEAYPSRGWRA